MKRVVRPAIVRQLSKANGSSESRGESKEVGAEGGPGTALTIIVITHFCFPATWRAGFLAFSNMPSGTTPDLGA